MGSIICIWDIICICNMNTSGGNVIRSQRQSRCDGATVAARVHVTDTYDVPDTDDAGPCEDIVVLAKTHSGASEDTYCGSDDDEVPVPTGSGSYRFRFIPVPVHTGSCSCG